MRYLIVALMIFLLPLRGWTGDAMATHMAVTAVSSETGATHTQEKSALTDCAGHQGGGQADSSVSDSAKAGTCQVCQACHTVALSSSTGLDSVLFVAPPPLLVTTAQFTSADTALGQKPPIF